MKKSERIERFLVYAVAVLLCLVLASSWLLGNIYARYTTSSTGSDSARVAKFSITEKSTLSQELHIQLAPGEEKDYSISVINDSEVAVAYSIAVENKYKNLPLKFEVIPDATQKTTETVQNENVKLSSYNFTGSGSQVISSEQIGAGDSQERKYTLKVSWPANENSSAYMGKVDIFTVTLKAVQID